MTEIVESAIQTMDVGDRIQFGFLSFELLTDAEQEKVQIQINTTNSIEKAHLYDYDIITLDKTGRDRINKLVKIMDEQFTSHNQLTYLQTNNWSRLHIEKDESIVCKFETEYDNNQVWVNYDSKTEEYSITGELYETIYTNSKIAAIMILLEKYVYQYSAYEYDRQVRLRTVAKERFDTLNHVYQNKSPVEDGIYTVEELLNNVDTYATDPQRLRESLQQMKATGNAPEDAHGPKKLAAELCSKNI